MAKRVSKFKYNGVSYTQIDYPDGRTEYNPPVPQELLDKWKSNFDAILETKRCPGIKTENSFFANRGTLEDQFKDDPAYLEKIVANARARGYEPNPNDVYFSSVADDDGDPAAFISQADGVGKLRKVCESRGLYSEELGTQRIEREPRPNVRLAEDLVQEKMQFYRQQPEHATTGDAELREMVIDTHGAKG